MFSNIDFRYQVYHLRKSMKGQLQVVNNPGQLGVMVFVVVSKRCHQEC